MAMKSLLPALLLTSALASFVLTQGTPYHKGLLERAKEEIEKDRLQLTLNGATSPKISRKKVTPQSLAVSERNTLFRKSMELLASEGVKQDQAREIVKEAFKEADMNRRAESSRGFEKDKRVEKRIPFMDQLMDWQCKHYCTEKCKRNDFQGTCVLRFLLHTKRCDCNRLGTPEGLGKTEGDKKCLSNNQNPSGRCDEFPDDMCVKRNIRCKPRSKFRSINGQCNNWRNPRWGSMSTCFERILPSIPKLFSIETYLNGPSGSGYVTSTSDLNKVDWFGVPQSLCPCSNTRECVNKAPVKLPNARLVSTNFFTDNKNAEDKYVTHMVTQFGQFVDHDLVLTPEEEEHGCCENFGPSRPSCFPIHIPSNDYFYQSDELKAKGHSQTCLDHSRSTGCCSDDFESKDHEQFNGITAFVDASNVYGSSDADSLKLRLNDGSGKLKVGHNAMLPIMGESGRVAGDSRANEMPGLATMHTIFVREHNRICDSLRSHPQVSRSWQDEDFFQNARRILIAQMQKIVYVDYLPIVLGRNGISKWNLETIHNSVYDRTVNPTLYNSFGAAAFRFGHSMIQGLIEMFHDVYTGMKFNQYELGQNYFNLSNYEVYQGRGFDYILIGLMMQKAQGFDRHVTEEVTNKLFANVEPPILAGGPFPGVGGDLIARNIQRGRDHGLPSYAAFYKHFHRPTRGVLDCWSKKPEEISQRNWNLLRGIYNHPHHIDLFVGGLAEESHDNGLVGKTFQSIIGLTFRNLMQGDKFFFTHRGNLNPVEYDQIISRTLGDIICDNSNYIAGVRENVFLINSPVKNCAFSRNSMSIKAFKLFRA